PWRQLKPAGCVLFPLLLSVTAGGRVRLFKARRGYCPCSAAAGSEAGGRLIDLQRESGEYLFHLTASSFAALRDGGPAALSLDQAADEAGQLAGRAAQLVENGEVIGPRHRQQGSRRMRRRAVGVEGAAVVDEGGQLGRAIGDGERLLHRRQPQRRQRGDLCV